MTEEFNVDSKAEYSA